MKKLVDFLGKAVCILSGLFLTYLTYNTMHYTFVSDFRNEGVVTYEAPDSRIRSLLLIVAAAAVFYIISKIIFLGAKNQKSRYQRVVIFLITDCVIVAVSMFAYVTKAYIEPYWDQAQVYNDALSFVNGDYSDMANTYLHKFPQQFGLILMEMPFLKFWDHFSIFQDLNVFFILAIIILSFFLCDELFHNETADFFAIVATTLFFPLNIYVTFIYGDLPSIVGCLFIALMIIKWMKQNKIDYIFWAILVACVSVLVRENTLIFLIACAISIILFMLLRKKPLMLLAAGLLIFLPLVTKSAVLLHFEHKGGEKMNNPIPSVGWITMGLQGDPYDKTGVGYYNGYNEATWWYQGTDTKVVSEYVKNDIKERVEYFKENPRFSYDFFRYKVLEQWIEPTFDSLYMTVTNYETAGELAVKFFSGDGPQKVSDFMNKYLTVAYFFALLYVVFSIRHDNTPMNVLLMIAFIGGFLFSLMWEAKGRYCMPYFVFLMIYSAGGVAKMADLINLLFKKLFGHGKAGKNGESR